MPIKSQFLYFYLDQFISKHWVNWLEGPLSQIPRWEHLGPRGFQEALGNPSSGPRTRAQEAFALGLLSHRIVAPRGNNEPFPLGWKKIIAGELPITRLGHLAYLLGKSLRENPNDGRYVEPLASLCLLALLHMCFPFGKRWCATAFLFTFARDQLEHEIARKLSNTEVRLLAGAVFNTLDGKHSSLLLHPYLNNSPIDSLMFEFANQPALVFKLGEIPELASRGQVGLNSFRKVKAALFWANADRGIYSNATMFRGKSFLSELMACDRQSFHDNGHGILDSLHRETSLGENATGIIDFGNSVFSTFSDRLSGWQPILEPLLSMASGGVGRLGEDTVFPMWAISQDVGRGSINATFSVEVTDNRDLLARAFRGPIGSERGTGTFDHHSVDNYLENNLHEVVVVAPKGIQRIGPKEGKQQVCSNTNFLVLEQRNRSLGKKGEEFVLKYERLRLRRAGRRDLAELIVWVSEDIGDGLGYDIASFSKEGEEMCIEVKCTNAGKSSPFYITANEIEASKKMPAKYFLYRVFDYSNCPRLYLLRGNMENVLHLNAIMYRATP